MAACEHGMPLTLGCDDCTIARLNKQRQDDEALIQRMLAALQTSQPLFEMLLSFDVSTAPQAMKDGVVAENKSIASAIAAARARLEKAP